MLCGLLSSCGERGLLFSCGARASPGGGCSDHGAPALGRSGFSSCSKWAQKSRFPDSRPQSQQCCTRARLLCARGIFLDQGVNRVSWHRQADSLPLSHQESPWTLFLQSTGSMVQPACSVHTAQALGLSRTGFERKRSPLCPIPPLPRASSPNVHFLKSPPWCLPPNLGCTSEAQFLRLTEHSPVPPAWISPDNCLWW